ncbi:MAG: hypothetical protein K0S38_581 [Candidatus Paceibacter sp.]|nr:hypothetical protein [Candidatus Paceibacter sp.]
MLVKDSPIGNNTCMHKKIIIPSIIGLVAAFATFTILVKYHQKAAEAKYTVVPTTNTQVAVDGMYTYSSDAYKISFQYPEKYVLEEKDVVTGKETHHSYIITAKTDKALMNVIGPSTDATPTTITINVFQGAATTQEVPAWVKSNANSNFKLSKNKVLATTTLAGIPAYAYSWDGLFGANSVAFAYKGNIIVASMTYITAQDVIWKDFGTVLQSIKLH